MPTHSWRCSKCKAILGQTNGRVLRLTGESIAEIEHARIATLIRCKCGGVRSFSSGSVRTPRQIRHLVK